MEYFQKYCDGAREGGFTRAIIPIYKHIQIVFDISENYQN